MNLYQYAKNEAVSSICSGEIVDLKILKSDWLRAFLPTQGMSQEEKNICVLHELGNKMQPGV